MISSGARHGIFRTGKIGIFNRSYYEEVLIARVHPEILKAELIPEDLLDKKRYGRTLPFDRGSGKAPSPKRHRIIKFFLHLSKEEQRERFSTVWRNRISIGSSP